MNYHDYLQLDHLLNTQFPESKKRSSEVHDELLFIIVHQVYELWFKQILHELNSVLKIFSSPEVADQELPLIVNRLHRVTEIQRLLVDQVHVLETMTPMDFLEFRDLLVPASGFQSQQFREIENKLGLTHRISYNSRPLPTAKDEPTLLGEVNRWLGRTPFLEDGSFKFWQEYQKSVSSMLEEEKERIKSHPLLSESEKNSQLERLRASESHWAQIFSGEGSRATQAALLIMSYREEPACHLPFQLLSKLIDIDENFATWRYRHALLVFRMIGVKTGTGGSSGFEYLKRTADEHRVFASFANLSTYLLPKSKLPRLPAHIKQSLGLSYQITSRN